MLDRKRMVSIVICSKSKGGAPHIANTPGNSTLLTRGRSLVGLTVDAQVHDVVAADGAVVDDDIPGPERDGVPLHVLCQYTLFFSN